VWRCNLRSGASNPLASSPGPSGDALIRPPHETLTSSENRNCNAKAGPHKRVLPRQRLANSEFRIKAHVRQTGSYPLSAGRNRSTAWLVVGILLGLSLHYSHFHSFSLTALSLDVVDSDSG
jgi:hypothetical protein